ncbi:hypothetical protein ACFOWZ_23485 [Lentzea rhizosphaerae]|uniref:Uncharacterized protein n=1 Tax=Lentzea rhizosphaerae TaxID=2041025 RepID=A0ABV8BXK9_9PSEU
MTLAALDRDSATEVDYVAERDASKPAAQRGRWRVTEDTMTLTGKRKRDPAFTLRRVLVHSTARANSTAPPTTSTDWSAGWDPGITPTRKP